MSSRWPRALLVVAFAALALRAAWLCDDAFITFRTVDNLANGLGATWNPGERVQAFTHPLWMLVLTGGYLVTGDILLTSLALSLVFSVLAVRVVAWRLPLSTAGAVVAVSVLALSKAFVDYSTSGLEGPLVHFLLALFALVWLGERGAFALALTAGLLFTTRPDTVPLVGPALALGLWRDRRNWRTALAGFLPALTWGVFALFYYGFPFPNTAYAKLSSGLPRGELIAQGLAYFANSWRLDPITLVAITGGVAAALWRRERTILALMAGGLLHLAYVLWIGGDFMSGRFLTAPLLVAVIVLARQEWTLRPAIAATTAALVLGLANPLSPVRAPTHYGADVPPFDHIDARGIADERAYWYHYTGAFSESRHDADKRHVTRGYPFSGDERRVRVTDNLGFNGFFTGPHVYWVDQLGLANPLLARLPIYANGRLLDPELVAFQGRPWRIGHFKRRVPDGYVESLETGENHLTSPPLAQLYEDLSLVTRGDLWNRARLTTIFSMNLVGRAQLVDEYLGTGD